MKILKKNDLNIISLARGKAKIFSIEKSSLFTFALRLSIIVKAESGRYYRRAYNFIGDSK